MEEQSETPGTIFWVSESRRPVSLGGASAWRDQAPELMINHIQDSDNTVHHLSRISEVGQSSTCHDRGDSAHLESLLSDSPPDTSHYPTLNTDELLASVGTGVYCPDPRLEFSDIPPVKGQDKTLEHQLRNATQKYPRNGNPKFIPIGDFDRIVTRDNVKKTIQSWLPQDRNIDIWVKAIWDTFDYDDRNTTRRKAFTSRRKIFAVLTLFNAQTEIASFIREGLWDKDLPFVQNDDKKWVYHPHRRQSKPTLVESLNRMDGHDADSFDNYQWLMLSPIFNMGVDRIIHHDLHPRIILPFLEHEKGCNPTMIGGQGEVSRVKIHESHYISVNSSNNRPEYFAIKQLMSPDKGKFSSEVESLKRFSKGYHPHLIKLLTTYHDGEKFNLIFPWADGNLRDLWKICPSPIKNYATIRWIAGQCLGIAKGLRMIHNNEFESSNISLEPNEKKMGRHGDMKPENILWFKGLTDNDNGQFENDVLKISDFGLTRWHGSISNEKTDIRKLAISRSYRAPEYDLLWRPVSQLWDIWSLACLYLEFLTWYLCGWNEGVDEFSKDRTKDSFTLIRDKDLDSRIGEDDFFNLTPRTGSNVGMDMKFEASLKRSVIYWINKLHETEGCSEFIHEFLDLISNNMLRVRSEKRVKCEHIAEQLDALYDKCKDESYCYKSDHRPRKKRRNDSDPSEIAILEFTEEMAKCLSTRNGVDSDTKAMDDSHYQGVRTNAAPPVHISSYSQDDQQQLSLDDSNLPTPDKKQVENALPIGLTPHTHPTSCDPTTIFQAALVNDTGHSPRQPLSDGNEQLQTQLSTDNQLDTDIMPPKLPPIEQNQVISGIAPRISILSPPPDELTGGTSSEQDRASSQNIKGGDHTSAYKDNGRRSISGWERVVGWIKSVFCLNGRSYEG
ncbi:uncharacterized protein GGS22DRAFT_195613 [Annulohypoxylon maeteangense]|uniref:uncharacterized protein n=1 Tax=Annulohypoxylon maeteangense TaxID=1927788 RepID=UPI0020075530|nr:uncharacterized protein GGS22DRAFT_195613 [Annulohypoxylon maeteangense]KAI0882889.1 hypothetical protein GGS22DRAFT_195613 [Annulohypoxylon maeteangense]